MLVCLPQSICSWNYRILDGTGPNASEVATLTLRSFSEEGTIAHGALLLTLSKEGMLTAKWRLKHGDDVIASAAKRGMWSRGYLLDAGGEELELAPLSTFTRAFELRQGARTWAVIRPAHAFTRRATIEGDQLPLLTRLFAFWLVVANWRRAQRKS